VFVTSTDPLLGGSDALSTGNGADVMIGGAVDDILTSAAGNDILIGDGGSVTYTMGGLNVQIVSVDVAFGGNDILDGGAGNDILMGGQGADLLYGTLSEDLLFGSNAAVTLSNGIVTSIQSDMQDLVTEAMFEQFASGKGKGTKAVAAPWKDPSGYLVAVSNELSARTQEQSLLADDVFRNMFSLGGFWQSGYQGEASAFAILSTSGTVTPTTAHDQLQDHTDEGNSGRQDADTGAAPQAALDDGQHPAVAVADDHGSDAVVLALGLVGLQAVQQPKSSGRRQVERDAAKALAGRVLSRMRRNWTSIAPR